MRMLRCLLVPAATVALAFPVVIATAHAQTKISIGKVIGGDGFHIPSYVAMDQGFFKSEGLDAHFVELQAKAQVTAVLSGNLDFAPIPSVGSQAALSGAKIKYIVGESLKSQWTISVQGEPERVAALVNNDIQGAALSIPHAATALNVGLKVLLRTGDYIPRAGGTIWGMQANVDNNPETMKKVIRAIAKGVMYFRDNKQGSIAVLKHHLGIKTDAEAGS